MQGSTLIEILIGLLILSLMLMVSFGAIDRGLAELNSTRWEAKAYLLLNNAVLYAHQDKDLTAWKTQVSQELPQGLGEVKVNQIAISWADKSTTQREELDAPI